jgi:hypothetical protein
LFKKNIKTEVFPSIQISRENSIDSVSVKKVKKKKKKVKNDLVDGYISDGNTGATKE